MTAPSDKPFGFNVIGHVTANLGLGVAARAVARAVMARGFPLAVLDIEVGDARDRRDLEFAAHCVDRAAALPYAINVFCVGVDTLRRMLDNDAATWTRAGTFNVSACFWELPTLPPRWLPALNALDVVVAFSDFMRYAFQFSLSGPAVIAGRIPVTLPVVVADRARFDIPERTTAFVTSFEPHSDPARKNIFATIEAFERGLVGEADVRLIVNVNNAHDEAGAEHAIVGALRDRVRNDARIVVSTAPLSYPDVLALYRSCDVYVSLHRAEGLGLGMAESMALGKPVIATGWSGNLTFMDHRNGCLVGYRLVAVDGTTRNYAHDQLEDTTVWAEPQLDDAANWMRQLAASATLRETIGAAAAVSIVAYNARAAEAGYLDEIRAIWERRGAPASRRAPVRHDPLAERTRSARLARLQQLEHELAWIKSRPAYRLAAAAKEFIARRRAGKATKAPQP